MYLRYLLLIVTSFVVCSDLPIVPPSTPPQDIKGRHFRKISSVVFSQVATSSIQQKDSPLKVSQDDNEDLIIEALAEEIVAQKALDADEELPFPMDDL